MPKDMWNPLSPNPKPWKPPGSGSARCPCGLGGTFVRGSCWFVLPRPYSGITFSLLIAALHTGHSCRLGRVSSHWCKHGQQNKCPHILTTASLAVSKQMLHSNMESSFFSSPPSGFSVFGASGLLLVDGDSPLGALSSWDVDGVECEESRGGFVVAVGTLVSDLMGSPTSGAVVDSKSGLVAALLTPVDVPASSDSSILVIVTESAVDDADILARMPLS